MWFKRLVATVVGIAGIGTGTLFSPTAQALAAVVRISVWNGTGANIGLINPADGHHTTRATALPVGVWSEVDNIYVPTDGTFVVIYGNTCLRVPGTLDGFTFVAGRYNVQLGSLHLNPTLTFIQDKSNPPNGVQVADNAPAASCAGL
ncbi:hypothetical protein D7D52_23210 [Nocardia yunnanensis]|uniref:Uncharacterized protein n=1 Tax=Nocardia yunnanensis TaxID=2382165 RepID=A0A386ZGL7_9NOCA|nr:hypothetical protein [Nocardia yunnanensis]AYF76254.1 hypothetical protein D7D52_23210 [Nocardia yunnanensis]